jgi:hypothetical protein
MTLVDTNFVRFYSLFLAALRWCQPIQKGCHHFLGKPTIIAANLAQGQKERKKRGY